MTTKQPNPNNSVAAALAAIPEAELTPRRIVSELDRFIVGQEGAKRAAAIALRNRWRRQQLSDAMREEVTPKNILMIGPTGVGKTEIARRLAKIVDAPFLKVEATKFTEVGYVGRDVESIVRDLTDVAVNMLHDERMEAVQEQAAQAANQRLADLLVEQGAGLSASANGRRKEPVPTAATVPTGGEEAPRKRATAGKRAKAQQRRHVLELLSAESLEEETVELELDGQFDFFVSHAEFASAEEAKDGFGELLDGLVSSHRSRKVPVREARRILIQQEAARLVDFDVIVETALKRVEELGIVFIDEIDKTITRGEEVGSEVSGEGVQRDLLPIVEGSTVGTRFGPVRTDHVLFIAAGAFSDVRPADLIPEFQGRFPIRVELASLDEDDLFAILAEPENALTKQYQQLLATEGVSVEFDESGLREMARLAMEVNERHEDIGARRLHTILERVLEEISFEAPERGGERVLVDSDYVRARVEEIATDDDLSNFIL